MTDLEHFESGTCNINCLATTSETDKKKLGAVSYRFRNKIPGNSLGEINVIPILPKNKTKNPDNSAIKVTLINYKNAETTQVKLSVDRWFDLNKRMHGAEGLMYLKYKIENNCVPEDDAKRQNLLNFMTDNVFNTPQSVAELRDFIKNINTDYEANLPEPVKRVDYSALIKEWWNRIKR
jgi:hypothetical protein